MFNPPVHFNEFLTHHGLLEDVYRSMKSTDLAEPVTTVLEILRKTNTLPPLAKESKTESKSTTFRNLGNEAYGNKKYQKALMYYNKALLFAPNYSRAMKLAYSNRSALLHNIKAYSACLNDIETCFSMGCPLDIIEKLRKRKDEAKNCIWMENLAEGARRSIYAEEYFDFKENPQISCANVEIGVVKDNEVPKIVATTDIKVGTVLAIEDAFVSITDSENSLFSCYYCHRMNLNLEPCEGCCFALFCNNICRDLCLKLYHSTECKIIDVIISMSLGTRSRLAIQAVLKMKYMSNSWAELHSASYLMGISRLKTNSIHENYDFHSKFSLLSTKNERHFLDGAIYNASFNCAAIIHHLETIHGFFPQTQEHRTEAVRAIARLLMFLSVSTPPTQIPICVSNTKQEKIEYHDVVNYGWFSFIGKLTNSCLPNCLAVGLNKQMGLIATAPIKKGSELTVSYVGHWLDITYDTDIRNKNIFMLYGCVCNCLVCTEEYRPSRNAKLTDIQKKNFCKLNIEEIKDRFNPRNIEQVFGKLSKTLAFISDLPYSDEYEQVYHMYRRCILHIQDVTTNNVILDYV